MKKILIIGLFLLMFNAVSANAANGDVIQPIYSTDILTYMDGIPIKGYAINGQMMICLEDLSDYGFSVHYDDEARCLFVNKTGKAREGFFPTVEKDSVGKIIGYTYETDIKAILNGEEIHTENIGGKLAATVEEFDDLKDDNLSGILSIKNYPKYFMMQSYNDFARILNVYSNIAIEYLYENNINNFELDIENQNVATEIVDKYNCEDFTQYIYRGASRMVFPTESLTVVRFYKNGNILDYTNILYAYSFIGSPVGTSIYDFEEKPIFLNEGKYLFFKGRRTADRGSIMGFRDTFEAGEYKINLDTCELEKVNIMTYDIN